MIDKMRRELYSWEYPVDKKFLSNVHELMNYLSNDEEEDFWCCCTCADSDTFDNDITLCTCENNQTHIWRTITEINNYLGEDE